MVRRDLTQGGIVRGIVAFALPLLGASVVQQLYSTVDMLFVGNVVGTQAVAALGVGSLLITLMVGLFSGMSVAANVRVANFAGVGDAAELRAAIRASMRIGIMGGLALAALGEALADPFIAAMEIPKESAADALGYLRFAVAATLPIAIFNMCSGALRGLGDSSTPFVAQAAGGVANVGANWFLLCVFGLGIEGCALATLASNGLAASIAVCVLVRRARECGVSGGGAGKRLAFIFGATVTDESFGVNLARMINGDWSVKHALLVNLFSLASWTVSNVAGALIGSAISLPTALASFAMTSLFICLLCMQKATPANLVAVFGSIAGVIVCKCVGLAGPAILIGALVGVGAAFAFSSVRRDNRNTTMKVGE